MDFYTKDTKTAIEAQGMAQYIAFGPVIFQVARVLRNCGILDIIEKSGPEGMTLNEIIEKLLLPSYGVRVLLESALGIGLVILHQDRYVLTKTGYFITEDPLTITNMDFVHDVCYKGLFFLDTSIANGKPEGLKELGPWNTIYEGLSQLPQQVQKSWFNFDHFFSDKAFPAVLPLVYNRGVKKLLDIGGNTGKWAIASAQYDKDVRITIVDLPGQLDMAKIKIKELGLTERISFLPINLLDDQQSFPEGFDIIWMSQFLDCFSESEIKLILKRCHEALDDNASLLVLEAFWDTQRFETAAFCLQQTSIYFTAIANGNSQMYHSEIFKSFLRKAGFEIMEQTDHIGLSHTLLKCRKKKQTG
jgi:ubiquinone/menaquinone biosynthesis C-methylase UbiE